MCWACPIGQDQLELIGEVKPRSTVLGRFVKCFYFYLFKPLISSVFISL